MVTVYVKGDANFNKNISYSDLRSLVHIPYGGQKYVRIIRQDEEVNLSSANTAIYDTQKEEFVEFSAFVKSPYLRGYFTKEHYSSDESGLIWLNIPEKNKNRTEPFINEVYIDNSLNPDFSYYPQFYLIIGNDEAHVAIETSSIEKVGLDGVSVVNNVYDIADTKKTDPRRLIKFKTGTSVTGDFSLSSGEYEVVNSLQIPNKLVIKDSHAGTFYLLDINHSIAGKRTESPANIKVGGNNYTFGKAVQQYESLTDLVYKNGLYAQLDDNASTSNANVGVYKLADQIVFFNVEQNNQGKIVTRDIDTFDVPRDFSLIDTPIKRVNFDDRWFIYDVSFTGDGLYMFNIADNDETTKYREQRLNNPQFANYSSLEQLLRDQPYLVDTLPLEYFSGPKLHRVLNAIANGFDLQLDNVVKNDKKQIAEFDKHVAYIQGMIESKIREQKERLDGDLELAYKDVEDSQKLAEEEDAAREAEEHAKIEQDRLERYKRRAESRKAEDISKAKKAAAANIKGFRQLGE